MIISKLTSKAQVTISQAVCTALGMKEGDELAYTIEDGRVVITKVSPKLPRKVILWRIHSSRSGSGIVRRMNAPSPICEGATTYRRLRLSLFGMSSRSRFPMPASPWCVVGRHW
jgi:bifunctional DNA-binding transcriptional regulator/antitoxin component of YhaV-PrlF toxin-antitoxin module